MNGTPIHGKTEKSKDFLRSSHESVYYFKVAGILKIITFFALEYSGLEIEQFGLIST